MRGVLHASRTEGVCPVPALEPYLIEPIFEQFRALLPGRETDHPLGCHRSRVPDSVVFEKLAKKASLALAARAIRLASVVPPANRHDSPLLVPTLESTSEALGALPEGASVHLDRGYDSRLSRERLLELGLGWEISGKGKPAPYWATIRWVVERTSSWHNAHKKLVWCTERVGKVIDFWVAFSDVVIIVRRLAREGWVRYRWEGRPSRRP